MDNGDNKVLFVQRIGIAGVAVLEARRLQVADRGEVPGFDGIKEVVRIVLVICRVAVDANRARRGRPDVFQVLRRSVVLEWLVVRNVIRLRGSNHRGGGAPAAASGSVGILDRQIETAFEEAPADAGGIEQVTDVRSTHGHLGPGGGGANVPNWICVAYQRISAAAV